MSSLISVRLPDELATAVNRLAGALDRPKTYLVRKALELYMNEYADYQIAASRSLGSGGQQGGTEDGSPSP